MMSTPKHPTGKTHPQSGRISTTPSLSRFQSPERDTDFHSQSSENAGGNVSTLRLMSSRAAKVNRI